MRIYLIILAFIAFAPSLMACSCDTLSFEDAIAADEIFVGQLFKAKTVEYPYTREDIYQWDTATHYTLWQLYFKVNKKWKGSNSDIVVIEQPNTSCDFSFDLTDSDYLIYTYKESPKNKWLKILKQASFIPVTGTYQCARNINISGYYDMNWFESDTAQLNMVFPHGVKLYSYPRIRIGIVTLLILTLIGFGLYQLIKRKLATPFTN